VKPWFKLWREAWQDRALLDLTAAQRWLWLTCLKLADEGEAEGEIHLPDWAIIAAACLRGRDARPDGIRVLVRKALLKRIRSGVMVPNWSLYQTDALWGGKRTGAGRKALVKPESRANQDESKMNARSETVDLDLDLRSEKEERSTPTALHPSNGTSNGQTVPPSGPPPRRQIALAVWKLYHARGELPRSDAQLFAFWTVKDADARRALAQKQAVSP
jgi:hypothetical protein